MMRPLLPAFLSGLFLGQFCRAETPVHFSREVLPILSDRCFHCHGPDASHRKADLRLDVESDARRVIATKNSQESELWRRVSTADRDELMPPPDSHRKPLSEKERETLRRWIDQGAPWGKHWAFEKPVRPSLPPGWKNPIDALVRTKLAEKGWQPAPPAEPHTLLRRLSFDLTGLPPLPGELKEDASWEEIVERKLSSPHHGERLAMWWLDAARYSDTDGYQQDAERTNWPWRDWVVDAFNRNLSFDQFTIEQFAGDLLPGAKPEQILATCFHRNHMTNGEGGRDPEESRIDYVIDRVNTTGTVWLGLTLGCVQCHDHKFDPVSQRDFYSLSAYFNSIDETGAAGTKANPYLNLRSPHAEAAVREAQAWFESRKPVEKAAREEAEKRFSLWLNETREKLDAAYHAWKTVRPDAIEAVAGTKFTVENDGVVQTSGPFPRQEDYRIRFRPAAELKRVAGWKLEVFPHATHTGGKYSRGGDGAFILTNVKLLIQKKGNSQVVDVEMKSAAADAEVDAQARNYGKVRDTLDDDPRNGWTTEAEDASRPHVAVFELAEPREIHPDEDWTLILFHRSTNGFANIGRFRVSITSERGETVTGLKTSPLEEWARGRELSDELRKRLLAQFLIDDAAYQAAREELDAASRQLAEVKKAAGELKVQVLGERKEARNTHILIRGVWDAKGEQVRPGVLPAILSWPAERAATRLDLARWIVSRDNPLTARVVVNHLWQILFGDGLVRTPEDFGLQGETPVYPELLDWLAVELMEKGWDLRHILRLIATSETYRQSSFVTSEQWELDPENRFLARASRYRWPAWMLRDAALQASGLLNPAIGGPPVKPWQPAGIWEEIFMGRFTYQPSVGPAQYRRTLYAFWRRSSAPAFLFDSAQRRVCEVGVHRTNTPLHALALLNDATMLEASRVLAEKGEGLDAMALKILSRVPKTEERTILERERLRALEFFTQHPEEARKFLAVGQQSPVPADQAAEMASWMTVASLLLNLDETMTHE